jgi:hypothetical protein
MADQDIRAVVPTQRIGNEFTAEQLQILEDIAGLTEARIGLKGGLLTPKEWTNGDEHADLFTCFATIDRDIRGLLIQLARMDMVRDVVAADVAKRIAAEGGAR